MWSYFSFEDSPYLTQTWISISDCPCIGEKPVFLQDEDLNGAKRPVIPIAITGEVFPWNNVRLPTFAHPTRYVINIHPNLTTLDVKG